MAFDISGTGQAVLSPLVTLWNNFVYVLPKIIVALIIIIVGYAVSVLIGYIVEKLLDKTGVDDKMRKANLADSIGYIRISSFLGQITKWYLLIIFLNEAVAQVNLGTLTGLLARFIQWLPKALIGLIIFVFGLILADFITTKISVAKLKGMKVWSTIIRVVIIFFVAVIALEQMDISVTLAEDTFKILVAGAALAVGLAFGMGAKDEAKKAVVSIRKHM